MADVHIVSRQADLARAKVLDSMHVVAMIVVVRPRHDRECNAGNRDFANSAKRPCRRKLKRSTNMVAQAPLLHRPRKVQDRRNPLQELTLPRLVPLTAVRITCSPWWTPTKMARSTRTNS